MSETLVEAIAATIFDDEYDGPFVHSGVAMMLFGKPRITYAEVKKGVEDGIYTESALSNARRQARAALSELDRLGYAVTRKELADDDPVVIAEAAKYCRSFDGLSPCPVLCGSCLNYAKQHVLCAPKAEAE